MTRYWKYLIKLLLVVCIFNANASEQQTAINYCVDPDWAPYESIVDGEHVGISKFYLDLIAQKADLRFNLIETNSWQQTLDFVKTKKCDLLPLLNETDERKQYLTFSDVYFKSPNAIYAHYDQPLIGNISGVTTQSLAVVSSYRIHKYLLNNHPNISLVEVNNSYEGLSKIHNKEVDYFIGSFHSANLIIQEHKLTDIRITGIAELEDNLRIGVGKGNEHLLPILNNAISKITTAEHNEVFNYLKPANIITKYDFTIAYQIGAVFCVVTLLLLLRYLKVMQNGRILADKNSKLEKLHRQLADKNQQLAELAIRDPLTQLYNRNHLSSVIEQQIKLKARYNTTACLIMIDIDDFKIFNDNHGHSVGDEVLTGFAKTLQQCARNSDIPARWGGEEFVLLCPETTLAQAVHIGKRFQTLLSQHRFNNIDPITCSIGIAELTNEVDADQWFTHADKAMYNAKHIGKNQIITFNN